MVQIPPKDLTADWKKLCGTRGSHENNFRSISFPSPYYFVDISNFSAKEPLCCKWKSDDNEGRDFWFEVSGPEPFAESKELTPYLEYMAGYGPN